MDDPNEIRLPSHPIQELALIGLKAALAAIPIAGGSLAEVFGGSIAIERHQRDIQFLEGVLNELRKRLDQLPETLGENEAFKTALLRAMRTAAETHDEEILAALRNAVVNVAIGEGPDDSLQTMFFDAIRGMTPWHMRLLTCIADPVAWAKVRDYPIASPDNPPDPATMLEAFYRGQLPAEDFQVQLLQGLYNWGLATNNTKFRSQTYLYDEQDTAPRISDLGKKFLTFITASKMPETHSRESQPPQAGFAAERDKASETT